MLWIPRFWSSSDKDVEAGIFRELEKYNISLDKCFLTCYEATFSKYGLKNGTHFRIEKNLSCRFNAASNCMARTHANKAKFPQKSQYKDFKNAWATLGLDTSSMVVFDH